MPISQNLKAQILDYLKQPIPQDKDMPIVEQSIPVPFFGDIENARVATISINPSYKEFVDKGKLLPDLKKRFTDRSILKAKDTDFLSSDQADIVYGSLVNYFHQKPYRNWFNWLEKYAGKMFGCSYYDGTMVHLDIYPWATQKRWSNYKVKSLLSYNFLKNILSSKDRIFYCVYINGVTVKKQIEAYLGIKIPEYTFGKWTIYKYSLDNGTMLIGSSCYIQNAYKKSEELAELHDILKNYVINLSDYILADENPEVVEQKISKADKAWINTCLCSVGYRCQKQAPLT